MSENPKIIIFRTDFEALQKGEKLENLRVFNSWEDVPGWQRETPDAFFIEVELSLTRADVASMLAKKAN